MNPIRLDNQFSAPLSKGVEEKMAPFLRKRGGDDDIENDISEAYDSLSHLASLTQGDHFLFTSSGAEAVNHIVFATYLDITRQTGKNHFIASALSEAPSLMAMSRLKQLGCSFEMVPANSEGMVTVESVAEMLTPRTAMLSLSWGDALTGVLQPVFDIAELCRDRGVHLHVEGSHVLGKKGFSFEGSGADTFSFEGELLHAPSGTGGLYIREGYDLSPLIMGGNDESALRGGSLNVSGLVGLGKAAKEALDQEDHICMEVARLRDLLENLVIQEVPHAQVLFKESPRLPHISMLAFRGVATEALLYLLHRKGVWASGGGGRLQRIQHVMKACGVKEPLCYSAVSFALSRDTTEEEIERGAKIIAEQVHRLQSCSKCLMEEGNEPVVSIH